MAFYRFHHGIGCYRDAVDPQLYQELGKTGKSEGPCPQIPTFTFMRLVVSMSIRSICFTAGCVRRTGEPRAMNRGRAPG